MKRLSPILAAVLLAACGGNNSGSSGSTGSTTGNTTTTTTSSGTGTGSTTGVTGGGSTGLTNGGSTGQTGTTSSGSGSTGTSATTTTGGSGSSGTTGGPPPANDLCANAIALNAHAPGDSDTVTGDTTNANDDFESQGCGGYGGDVFYSLHLTAQAEVQATLTPSDPTKTGVVSILNTCTDTQELVCDDTTPAATATAILPAGDYIVVADNLYGDEGPFSLAVTLSPAPPPPANDTCASATTLPEGAAGLTAQTLTAASNDYAPDATATGCTGQTESGADVAFTFTPSQTSTYKISVNRTAGSADLDFYLLGTCPASGAAITSCVDGAAGSGSTTTKVVSLTQGTAYTVVVDTSSANATGTTFDISAQQFTPPAGDLCSIPVSLTVHQPGDTQTVSGDTTAAANDFVSSNCAGGGGDLFYQVTLSADAELTATLTPGDSTKTSVVSVTPSCGAQELSCTTSSSTGVATLTQKFLAAGTYYVVADNYSGDDGPFSLTVTLTAPVYPPAGENCAGIATDGGSDLTLNALGDGGLAGSLAVDTTPYSNDSHSADNGACFGYGAGNDVVYRVTLANAAPSLTATLTPYPDAGSYEPVLYLRSSPCADSAQADGGPSSELACDSPSAGQQASISAASLAAGTYYLWVDGFGGTKGPATLSVSVP